MGKSLKGKELGKGITQRKDGLYQARFVNRFGKRETLYAKTYNEIQKKMCEKKYENEKEINSITSNITLEEWFNIWINTCKKNCRNNSKEVYVKNYRRIKEELGWRKLNQLNLIVLQKAFNNLNTDNERKNSKMTLVDMLDKAVDSNLIAKNVARQINTVITKEVKKERRVLTRSETDIFLKTARTSRYYCLFVVALETGMRIGELSGLQWEDIDFKNRVIHVRHSMTYFQNIETGKYCFELHSTKTNNSLRDIPLTDKAITALKEQYLNKQRIINKNRIPIDGYENLVFVSLKNTPIIQHTVAAAIDRIVEKINKENPNINFERLTTHTFRHTFATRCLEANIPLKTVSALLGHAQLQLTTDLYMHVTTDSLFDGMKLYEKMSLVG